MTRIPVIDIFVRHAANCEHRDDERYKRCRCRKHLRWTWQGKQYRQTAETRSWDGAERAKRELELKYETAQMGKPLTEPKAATVEQAVQSFLNEKQGGKTAGNTLAKYKLTLSRLQEFCDRQNLRFISEIRLEHLSQWRAEWNKNYSSAFALRNNQSRVRHFFRYCKRARMIMDNPAPDLSAIKISDDDYKVDPFTEKQYKTILATISKCDDMSEVNRQRVNALMQLQRWSGLSLVDAVCLERGELVKVRDRYRIDTSRRKTGTRVSNVVPVWLGRELLNVKNGNAQYFFWSGKSTAKSATSVYDKLYRRVFQKAGIVNGGSHRFRHMLAITMLDHGSDMKLVSKAMGHKSMTVTEKFYGKWSTGQQLNLERALTKAWST